MIYGMVSADRRSSAGFATMLFMSVLASTYTLLFKEYIVRHSISAWIVLLPALLVFIIFFLLYGSEKELKALEERRKNDSVLWPFLLVLLLVGSFLYALL